MFDKYAPYIFSAYGITAAILGGLVLWSVIRVIQAKKKLDAVEGPGSTPAAKEESKP
jgi:heme exporter protein CcmD